MIEHTPEDLEALKKIWEEEPSKTIEPYDPYGDIIRANRESEALIWKEGLVRAQRALDRGFPETAKLAITMALCYHPMHEESWPGWPAEPWVTPTQREGGQ